jgi:hypothetical protein
MEQPIKKEKGKENVSLIMHDIHMVSVDRTMKDIAYFRSALRNAESIYYPNRTRLYDLYEDVKLDGHLTGIMNKRIDAVLNKQLCFYKDDKEVEEIEPLLGSMCFRELKKTILQTIFHGISGMEFIPGAEIEFEEIPRKHIKPENGVIAQDQSSYEGTPYKDLSNVWVIGKKRDYGLLLHCSVYALYKKGGFGDYAQYLEIFGQPIRVFKYDANDITTKTQLAEAANNAGSSLALVIPNQANFEIMDGKSSNANGDLQKQFIESCNNEMDIAILGNTETTGNSNGGSNAKAKEHGKQQNEITKSDMIYLLNHLNTPKCLAILKSYGFPVDGGKFKFEKEIDLTALTQKSVIDATVISAVGLPVSDDYFYDTYGITKPDNYDELKKKKEDEKLQSQQKVDPKIEPIKKDNKLAKDKKKVKPENLTAWQNLMAKLSNFFDQAHKD